MTTLSIFITPFLGRSAWANWAPVAAFLAVQLAAAPATDVFKLFSCQLIEFSAAGAFCPKNLSMAKCLGAIFPVERYKTAPCWIIRKPIYVHAQHTQLKQPFFPLPMAVLFFPREKLMLQFLLSGLFDHLLCEPNPFGIRYISDIGHYTTSVTNNFVPAFARNKVAPSGIIVNAKICEGQLMISVSDVIHLRCLTMRACGFLPAEFA